ncbi:MAG TPA: 3-phosphoshikimate 1-carboxyvinyltransferase, partial [Nannocystis exedens]|nr:3-phosphoshikimate 1-carboxyvinyltransferase [Nannocystis exedens]
MAPADALAIRPLPVPLDGREVRPPGSKSLTNRALLLAGLARGRSTLRGCLESEDTQLMRAALARLGVKTAVTEGGSCLDIDGAAGPFVLLDEPTRAIDVGTAGTAARFLSAALAASPLRVRVDGSPRMRERPMAQLLDTLEAQGARLMYHGRRGALPVTIVGAASGLLGGEIRLARPSSSQFISALILAAPLAQKATSIVLEAGTPARPYVDMTLETL